MIPAFERFVVGIAIMPLDDFPKLASIDRFEEFPKNAIHISHARPLSESRQPESIRFTLDLPGMRCGIVNRSRDRPAGGGAFPALIATMAQREERGDLRSAYSFDNR